MLAVGTGLGSAAIVYNDDVRGHAVVPLEAGHVFVPAVGLADPLRKEEQNLFQFMAEKHSAQVYGPEYECFASGKVRRRRRRENTHMCSSSYLFFVQGLANLYEYTSGGKQLAASEVAQRAVAGTDEAADAALLLHYRYLVRCAQNVCVTLQLREGIFWAGDNGVANAPWIRRHAQQLRGEFLHHHKAEWIAETPLYIQTQQTNFNLIGAIFRAELAFPAK